ncbi:MAG: tetratricopeptide repeat protein, partial [Thermoanaerobaculia bacterium]
MAKVTRAPAPVAKPSSILRLWAAVKPGSCDEFLDHLVAGAMWGMAYGMVEQGRAAEGEAIHLQALELRRSMIQQDDALVGNILVALGRARFGQGDLDRAEEYNRGAMEIPGSRLSALLSQGELLSVRGRPAEALRLLAEAEELDRQLGRGAELTGLLTRESARANLVAGNLAGAERRVRDALEHCRAVFGDRHRHTARARRVLGETLLARGEPAAAEQ